MLDTFMVITHCRAIWWKCNNNSILVLLNYRSFLCESIVWVADIVKTVYSFPFITGGIIIKMNRNYMKVFNEMLTIFGN